VAGVAPVGAVVAGGRVVAVVLLVGPDMVVAALARARVVAVVPWGDEPVVPGAPAVGPLVVVAWDATLVEVADAPGIVPCGAVTVEAEMAGDLVTGAASRDPLESRTFVKPRRFFSVAPARMPVPLLSFSGIPTDPATSVVRTLSRPSLRADSATTPTAMSSATKTASHWIS
jgi:hypothetical protein